MGREPRCRQHGEERADVNGHIVHGKCTVQTRIVLRIAGGEQRRGVGFKQAVTDGDGRHTGVHHARIVTGPRHQRVADGQYDSAQNDNALGTQNFIAQPAADSDQAVNQGTEGGEERDGVGFRHTQLFNQVDGHNALQAVKTKAFPQFYGEDEIERFGLFKSVHADAFS